MHPVYVVTAESHYDSSHRHFGEITWPILICLLGNFRVLLKAGRTAAIHGSKAEGLLCRLALQSGCCATRDALLEILWPDHAPALARQSLNSLLYSLHKLLGDEINGQSPVLHQDGAYRLNTAAGVGVDVAHFDDLVRAGNQYLSTNDLAAAAVCHAQAVRLYQGDLCGGTDIHVVVERERLRARFLTVLAGLADYYFSINDYTRCLEYAGRLLQYDPCREDAHRLVMRCHVRRGERAQALRQYRLCQDILHAEFDVAPEPLTTALFDQVRLDPTSI